MSFAGQLAQNFFVLNYASDRGSAGAAAVLTKEKLIRLVLLKCNDIKMVKSPGGPYYRCSFMRLTNNNNKKITISLLHGNTKIS